MDGERRIARPLSSARGDVRRGIRGLARFSAVAFLAVAVLHGASKGGHLNYEDSPFARLPGQLSSLVGMAADDVKITGLSFHDPRQVLAAIHVTPGGSLFGFDAQQAREQLRKLDWVADADVQRVFPNSIAISISERDALAAWQIDGRYLAIGRDSVPMTGLSPEVLNKLPLVTGPGANEAAAELVNQLSAVPDLMMRVHASARVGQRRWNLYLDNGVKIALPEQGVKQALEQIVALDMQQGILSKGIRGIDLRHPNRLVVALAEVSNADEAQTVSQAEVRQ